MSLPLFTAPDGQPRCAWCAATPDDVAYHDREWGWPVADDTRLFETISLEAFQSGLSWRTILAKRAAFRVAFAGFDIDRVAAFDARDVARLLADAGIVRHRGKIEAVIGNARAAQRRIAVHGPLAPWFWSFEPATPPALGATTCAEAVALARALKAEGWAFVGPTTVYAFMQAMGLVNDHAEGCVTRAAVATARAGFARPR